LSATPQERVAYAQQPAGTCDRAHLHRARLWPRSRNSLEVLAMLHYAVVFLVIALIAGVLGFGGIAGSAVGIAKILFAVFIILFVVSLLMGRRGRP
jgi:uncharacterized membrane protein YtjA (UPF0391 family)